MSIIKKNIENLFSTKLVATYVLSILIVCTLLVTTAGFLYYNNVDKMLSNFSVDLIEKNQQQIINNSIALERQLNKITGQIFSDQKIYNSLIYPQLSTNEERKEANDTLRTFLYSSDVSALYFWDAQTEKFYNISFAHISDEDVTEELGDFRKIIDDAKNGRRFFTSTVNNTPGYASKSSNEFWVIYTLNHDALLSDSVLNYNGCDTAIYYKNKLFIASDYSLFSEELDVDEISESGYKKHNNELVHTYKTSVYTSVAILPDKFINVWYSDTLKNIWLFAGILIVISIFMIALFGLYYHNAAQTYLTALSVKSKQNRYSDIKALLTKCIHNKTVLQEDYSILHNFTSEMNYENIHCVIIQLDYLNRLLLNNSYNEITGYMKQLKLICENRFSEFGTCVISDFDVDTVGILVFETTAISEQGFLKLITDIKAELASYLSLSVTSTVSNGFLEDDEIIYTFLKLDNLKNCRYMLGYNSVITEKNDRDKEDDIPYPDNLNKELSSAILVENREKYLELLEKFEKEISSCTYETAKNYIFTLFFDMIKYFSLQSKLKKNINVISELSICETLEQSIDILKNLFPAIPLQSEYATDNFISQVEKITSENYMNIDYNISYIADAMNISTVYAGNKFKKMFQKTFTTYLAEYRIKIATDMLRTSDCKSTELAEKCGFASSSYFIKTFKKYTSMTPVEFRALQKTSDE